MKNNTITIGACQIGKGYPSYFIADIAANHDGDIRRAKELIHMAAEAGANAAKFQNFKAAKIVSDYGFKSLGTQCAHQRAWKKSVFEVYADASIDDEWSPQLKDECRKAGIHYATSPYDFASVDWADNFVDFFKIGSGDITWLEICCRMAKKEKPIILSTGASELCDVKNAVNAILEINSNLILMQCNTNYNISQNSFQFINLRVLNEYERLWPMLIFGLSDHTLGYATVLGAIALGACVVEKHFTDDTQRTGPDHAFSMTPKTWREMVDRSRELEDALGDGIKKIELNEKETVILQRRVLRATRYMYAGHILVEDDLFPLRPAPLDGFAPFQRPMLIGRKLAAPLAEGEHITPLHFDFNSK
jgi:N-acetylneuraminate synthase